MTTIPDIKLSPKTSATKPRSKHKIAKVATEVPLNSKSKKEPKPGKLVNYAKRKRRKQIIISIVAIVLVIFGASGSAAYAQGKVLYSDALAAKTDFIQVEKAFTDKNFDEATQALVQAQYHLHQAQQDSDKMAWIKWVPGISTQFKAVDSILAGGTKIAVAAQDITQVGRGIFNLFPSDNTSWNDLSAEQRKQILQKVSESPNKLTNAQQQLAAAIEDFQKIPAHGVIGQLASITKPIQEKLPLAQELVDKSLPLLEVIPSIVGYPSEQTYLFLLENNNELRPTGGFIGTYGILVLQEGAIKDFKTDNIYNLDNPAKSFLFKTPPAPMARYLRSTQWLMRDSNWNPDFPTTAKIAEQFYHDEKGPINNIDGVIAVTPTFIQSLVQLTGTIKLDGQTYAPETIIDQIEEQSEASNNANRKAVIGKLANVIKDKLLHLPKSKWGDLWEVILTNLDEKQILINSKNVKAQALVDQLGWDGAVKTSVPGDFLMVVDANLATLKTDKYMVKTVNYSVSKQGNDYIATVVLNYKNTNKVINKYYTRYQSYTRIYVPQGSDLMNSDGFYTASPFEGGKPISAAVDQDDTVQKTIFQGLIPIDINSEHVVKLQYKLPPAVVAAIESGQYELYLEKQAGIVNETVNVTVDFGKNIRAFSPQDQGNKPGSNKVEFSTPFNADKQFSVQY